MSDSHLRVRSISEIVDAAVELYRRNGMQYITAAAIATAPSIILNLILNGGGEPTSLAGVMALLPGMIIGVITYAIVSATIIRMGSDVYLGSEPDVAATVRNVLPLVPTLIGASFVTTLLLAIAAVFFFFPVFYALALLFATVPIIVLERKGVFGALSRSAELSKNRKKHILGTLLLVYGIFFVLSIGVSALATVMGNYVVQLVVQSLFSIVASPILNLVVMVLYYDARIRAEGFDVEHMAGSMGSTSPLS
ncbi:MAG: glycerophosphoryl diester phosphodiesterase membrane domain-containing protein [Gemmatimonadaceae bacterium]|nr:glycerophosphoryl diester phosphodiesterase membrane domain-containing protein [Gemmatimonadaceae bacterium]